MELRKAHWITCCKYVTCEAIGMQSCDKHYDTTACESDDASSLVQGVLALVRGVCASLKSYVLTMYLITQERSSRALLCIGD